MNNFLFGIYPYIAITVMVMASIIRYDREPYTWRSGSSQLLRRRQLVIGSILFHAGVLLILGGHLGGDPVIGVRGLGRGPPLPDRRVHLLEQREGGVRVHAQAMSPPPGMGRNGRGVRSVREVGRRQAGPGPERLPAVVSQLAGAQRPVAGGEDQLVAIIQAADLARLQQRALHLGAADRAPAAAQARRQGATSGQR